MSSSASKRLASGEVQAGDLNDEREKLASNYSVR
jgi:hypothetical protein